MSAIHPGVPEASSLEDRRRRLRHRRHFSARALLRTIGWAALSVLILWVLFAGAAGLRGL